MNGGDNMNNGFKAKDLVLFVEQLYENIWGYNYASDAKNLSSFIRRLRKKIEPNSDNPEYIMTVLSSINSTKKKRLNREKVNMVNLKG